MNRAEKAVNELAKLLGITYAGEGRFGGEAHITTADGKRHSVNYYPALAGILRDERGKEDSFANYRRFVRED